MIIVRGSNVYCSEVEQVIATHEMIHEVAVIGIPLDCKGETIVACVVLRKGCHVNLAQLQKYCESSLARYKWPSHLFILDALPRTAVDKVDKKLLRKELSLSVSEAIS
nr:hypothetical protein [Paenibacillus sp. Marseille-Q4541]